MQSARGNRLRLSSWLTTFGSVPDLQTRTVFQWTRRDQSLPSIIDPGVTYTDHDDLVVGAVILASSKREFPRENAQVLG
jgi:hypothetical protein